MARDRGDEALASVPHRVGARVIYTYDFGDSWEHGIVLEKRLPVDSITKYPVCTDGQLARPPEDCGGIPGFYDLVEVILTPTANGTRKRAGRAKARDIQFTRKGFVMSLSPSDKYNRLLVISRVVTTLILPIGLALFLRLRRHRLRRVHL